MSEAGIAESPRACRVQGKPFRDVFPDAHPDALDLLERMLKFDPRRRISVEDALSHPYVASIRGEEPSAPSESLRTVNPALACCVAL